MHGEDGGFNLDEDRDRLPWLEPAEMLDESDHVPPQKIAALVLLGIALLGLIGGGGWWLMSRTAAPSDGEVRLIRAAGPYKIKAPDPKAKEFQGEGDEAYSASAGGESNGRIDASKAPEVPITERVAAAPAKAEPAKADGAQAKTAAASAPASPGTVQLGAYASQAIAQEAWKRLVKRFEELKGNGHNIESVVASNGKTLFRLRMDAGSSTQAKALCGRLRVAGEVCWVVS